DEISRIGFLIRRKSLNMNPTCDVEPKASVSMDSVYGNDVSVDSSIYASSSISVGVFPAVIDFQKIFNFYFLLLHALMNTIFHFRTHVRARGKIISNIPQVFPKGKTIRRNIPQSESMKSFKILESAQTRMQFSTTREVP
ncbi:hypothetical protein CEXT_483241, partial [Caerostris extrusa]